MSQFGDERLPERFWSKVSPEPNTGCWLWMAGTLRGYGRYSESRSRRRQQAHRVAYEALVGTIPPGLEPDHLCRVRGCVNPDHIEPVTRAENARRGAIGDVNRTRAAARTSGVIVVATDSEGNIETRLFGNVRRYSLTYAGAVLTDHAMNGDFEPWPEEGGTGDDAYEGESH